MGDYIDRQEAINLFSWFLEQGEYIPPEYLVEKLMELQAKNVLPVIHAHWEDDKCTNCGYGVNPWNNTAFVPGAVHVWMR